VQADLRGPLRTLDDDERRTLDRALETLVPDWEHAT
jgi:hypothetical protein